MKSVRPIRIEGDVAYVPLTQGYEAIIDTEDVNLVFGRHWYAVVSRKSDGTIRSVYAMASTRRECGGFTTSYMHRVIAATTGGMATDHRDGNGLNNRRSNLREATAQQNQHNARISSANTSGVKGVGWDKDAGKWRASIRRDGKLKFLGLFSTPEIAHAAYCKASADMHGEFGRVA